MSKENKMTAAIDYYKQGIKVNNRHAEIMFNLGWCYNRISKYKMALKWFKQASMVKTGWVNPLYGISLIYLKLGMSEESIEYNEKALRWYGIDELTKINLLYMRAYWCKMLKNYIESADIYKEILEKAEKFEFNAIQKSLWDSILTMIQFDQSVASEIKIQLESNN